MTESQLREALNKIMRFGQKPPYDPSDPVGVAIEVIVELFTRSQEQAVIEGKIEELTAWEPLFKGDHRTCINYPEGCVGYMNAQSDFDNEKEIRIAELQSQLNKLEEK